MLNGYGSNPGLHKQLSCRFVTQDARLSIYKSLWSNILSLSGSNCIGGGYKELQDSSVIQNLSGLGGFTSTSFPAATVRSLAPAFIPQCQISTSGESPTFHLLGHIFYRLQDPPKPKGTPCSYLNMGHEGLLPALEPYLL